MTGHFAKIPNQLEGTLTVHELACYVALTWHADAQGIAFPTHSALAAATGCSKAQIKRALKGLRAKGLVSWETEFWPNGVPKTNVYHLTPDGLEQADPLRVLSDPTVLTEPVGGQTDPIGEDVSPENRRGLSDPTVLTEPLRGPGDPMMGSDRPGDGVCVSYRSRPNELDPNIDLSSSAISRGPDPSPGPEAGEVWRRLCDRLADRICANGSRRPQITKRWLDAARLLVEQDGRTVEQVERAIDWCQGDEFWRSNILSMPKLRAKYDQLRLQAARGQPRCPHATRSTTDERVAGFIQLGRQMRQNRERGTSRPDPGQSGSVRQPEQLVGGDRSVG